MKKNIALFFGGVSCEHDISVITATQVNAAMPKSYDVYPVYIHTNGLLYHGNPVTDINFHKNPDISQKGIIEVCLIAGCKTLYKKVKNKLKPICGVDCAVLATHGGSGEDGSLQGYLKMCGIPFSSADVLGSSAGMDKIALKAFFKGMGLKVLPSLYFTKRDYIFNPAAFILRIERELGYPVIVKPSTLGSSIGISVCKNKEELDRAIDNALLFDRRILIERAEQNFIEINCSAMRIKGGIQTSECEQPVKWKDFLKFEDKYMSGSMSDIKRIFPAEIDKETSDKIKNITKEIYKTLNLKGVIRADFIVSDDVYINEINTIPGSLSYYLWETEDLPFNMLIDNLIDDALRDFDEAKKLKTVFHSSVLGGKGKAATKR